MSEIDIQNRIRVALSVHGICVRLNTGYFMTQDGRMVKCGIPGMPDLLFIGPEGVTVWIEVKTDAGRLRPEQTRFLERLKAMGHKAGVARSVDDALRLIGRNA